MHQNNPSLDISGKRLIFIVGVTRSGTTWLQLLLSASPQVATSNETHLFSSYLESCFRSWNLFQGDVRGVGLASLLGVEEYYNLMRAMSDNIFARIALSKPDALIILEKTPDHVYHWNNILHLYPDAAFIHIIRDPRSVVASMRDAGRDWGASWIRNTVAGCCRDWARGIAAGQEIGRVTDNYFEVRYEALKADGPKVLFNIFDWIGVPTSESECATIIANFSIGDLVEQRSTAPWDLGKDPARFYRRGESEGWRDDLKGSQVALIESLLKKEMGELGYTLSSSSWRAAPSLFVEKIRGALRWRIEEWLRRLSA